MRIVLALLSLLTALPATAQDMTYEQLEDLTRTRFASLTAHLPVTSPPAAAPCDRSIPGQTHVILLGAEDFGPLNDVVLQGTRASIDLIGQSLVARGVKAENITPLTGPYANRATLTLAVETLLAKLTCTDTALLYITGVSANTQSISMVMTGGVYEDDWISGLSDRFPIMRAITDAAPFMVLNPSGAAQEELISAAAVSEVVTLLRNRAGHVAVVIDTTYAAAFDL
jgi:hypothetical protein